MRPYSKENSVRIKGKSTSQIKIPIAVGILIYYFLIFLRRYFRKSRIHILQIRISYQKITITIVEIFFINIWKLWNKISRVLQVTQERGNYRKFLQKIKKIIFSKNFTIIKSKFDKIFDFFTFFDKMVLHSKNSFLAGVT